MNFKLIERRYAVRLYIMTVYKSHWTKEIRPFHSKTFIVALSNTTDPTN